jgi:glucose/arabinose dehydrogenase
VSLLRFDEAGQVISKEPFLNGFLQGSHDYDAWGHLVDLPVMSDGSLLISDDTADTIYRVTYSTP